MKKFTRATTLAAIVGALSLIIPNSARATTTADIIFVVDESGSMSGEHAWIGSMVGSLDAALIAAGVTGNQYGLVGFGGGSTHIDGHTHLVGGGSFGTAAQLTTAIGGLVLSGGTEDGWDGIDHAMSYTFRTGAAVNIILVTDEDRDVRNGALTFASVLAALDARGAMLNAVVNATYGPGTGILGYDSTLLAYKADGSGGFTTVAGGTTISAAGTTKANYIDMALATEGAAWDLNKLRAGGLTAQSFTEAFVDIKVQEIVTQVPDSASTVALFGASLVLLGCGYHRRLFA